MSAADSLGPAPVPAEEAAALRLCLVVAGASPHSRRAAANLRALCAHHLPDCEVEVLDLYRCPERAARLGVRAAPMLLRLAPAPVRRVAGDLADPGAVLRALGLAPHGLAPCPSPA